MSRKYKDGDRVPSDVLSQRLDELAHIVSREPKRIPSEFVMRIPAELDRCPDLVMSQAATRLIEQADNLAKVREFIAEMYKVQSEQADRRAEKNETKSLYQQGAVVAKSCLDYIDNLKEQGQ